MYYCIFRRLRKVSFNFSNRTRFRKLFSKIIQSITKQKQQTNFDFKRRIIDIEIFAIDKQNFNINKNCNSITINIKKIKNRQRKIVVNYLVVDFVYSFND